MTRSSSTAIETPTTAATYALVGLTLLCFAIGQLLRFQNWNFDDGMIVYRVVHNILDGWGWTYNVGEIRNVSTSALNTILITGIAKFTGDIPLAAHLLGAAALFFSGILTFLLLQRSIGSAPAAIGSAIVIMALGANYTWGIESNLFICSLLYCCYLRSRERNCWLALGLAILIRPDAALLAVLVWLLDLTFNFVGYRKTPWTLVYGPVLMALVIAPWAWFSLQQFGEIFPATLASKIWQGQSGFWGQGHVYLKALAKHILYGERLPLPIYVLGGVGSLMLLRSRSSLALLIVFVALQQLFYIFINVPGYHWYFAAFDAAMLIAGVYLCGKLWRHLMSSYLSQTPGSRLETVFHTATLIILCGLAVFDLTRAVNEQNQDPRDQAYRSAAKLLSDAKLPDGKLAALEVGTLGFHNNRSIVDLVGLTSPNPEFISGKHNDEFFANPPAIVLLHQPLWHFERALYDDLRFRLIYKPAGNSDSPPFSTQWYVLNPQQKPLSPIEITDYVKKHFPNPELLKKPLEIAPSPSAFCIFDQINGQIAFQTTTEVPPTLLRLNGWTVLHDPQTAPKDPKIVLGNSASMYLISAKRFPRPDVALQLGSTEYENSGFEAEVSLLDVIPGTYDLGTLQTKDGVQYYCHAGKQILVRDK